MFLRLNFLLLVIIGTISQTMGKLWLPNMISSSMVLTSAPLQTRIWGKSSINQSIKLSMDASHVHWGVGFHKDERLEDEQLTDLTNDQNYEQPNSQPIDVIDLLTTSSSTGDWSIDLPQQSASINWTFTITAMKSDDQSIEETIVLTDIAFGLVLFCAGQSNMEMSIPLIDQSIKLLNELIDGSIDRSIEPVDPSIIQSLDPSIKLTGLRLLTVENHYADEPVIDIESRWGRYESSNNQTKWTKPSIDRLTDGQIRRSGNQSSGHITQSEIDQSIKQAFDVAYDPFFPPTRPFSALCYLTGRSIYLSLNGKVPIGLITAAWGGTPIEPWMSKDCEQECGFFNLLSTSESEQESKETENESVYRRFSVYSADSSTDVTYSPNRTINHMVPRQSIRRGNRFSLSERHPSNYGQRLWNGMLAPFLPMNLTAFLWHQGESNRGSFDRYDCFMRAFIKDVRQKWRPSFNQSSNPTGDQLGFFYGTLSSIRSSDYSSGWMEIWKAQAQVMNQFDEQSIKESLSFQMTKQPPEPPLDRSYYPSVNQLINHNIGLASCMDVSDTEYFYNAVHARNKSVLAWRMARLVMTTFYPSMKQSNNNSVQIPLVSRGPMLWSEDQSVNRAITMLIDRTVSTESLQHSIFAEIIDSPINESIQSTHSPAKLVVHIRFPPIIENVGLNVMSTPNCISCCDDKSSSVISLIIDQSHDRSSNPLNFYHQPDDLVISEFEITAVFLIRESVPLSVNQSINVAINFHSFFIECALYNFAHLPMLPVIRAVTISKPVDQSFELKQPKVTSTGQSSDQMSGQTNDQFIQSSGQLLENQTIAAPSNHTDKQGPVNQTQIESINQSLGRSFTELTGHPAATAIVLLVLLLGWILVRRIIKQSKRQSYQAVDIDDQSNDQGFDQSISVHHVDDSDPLIVDDQQPIV